MSLARSLNPAIFDVSVACLYNRGELLKELSEANVQVLGLGKRGRWDLVGFLPRLIRSLRRHRPDIVHAYLGPPNVLAAVAAPWLPGCRVIWGVRASNMDLDHYDWSWRVTTVLERLLARNADRIVANSYAGRESAMANGLPGERIMVIPNGIDVAQFEPNTSRRTELRNQWGIEADAFLIGKIARFDPMKDHRTFFKAAARAAANVPRLQFVCVGDGPATYVESLRREADALRLSNRLVWAGAHTNMVAVYSAIDAVALTSAFGEGFPNVVGEAMACGRACVVTDVGDAARVVGDTGIVVQPGDVTGIARGWETLAGETPEDQENRRHQCRARIVKHFSLTAMVDAHTSLYGEIIGSDSNTSV